MWRAETIFYSIFEFVMALFGPKFNYLKIVKSNRPVFFPKVILAVYFSIIKNNSIFPDFWIIMCHHKSNYKLNDQQSANLYLGKD